MLGFVQNWFGPKANPIGVDFGSDSLRLAQVQFTGDECRLIAAASADVPSHVRHDPAARWSFFVETARDLLAQGEFRGRQAILALPVSTMFFQHLRMAKMDEEALKKALPWEARGKLPIDPSYAVMRHLIAGEVYNEQDPKLEVIVMAAGRDLVNHFLANASKARLEVVGMNVEPRALLDCFLHRPNPKDAEVACYVDIGCSATRIYITNGHQIMFARAIPVGGEHFNRAVSNALKISFEDAKLKRIKLAAQAQHPTDARAAVEAPAPAAVQPGDTQTETEEQGLALLGAALRSHSQHQPPQAQPKPAAAPAGATGEASVIEQACREPLMKLVEEMNLCRRYHEATFPNRPVARLVFIGGEARHRSLCQQIAREMALAAQIGDPISRLAGVKDLGIESGIDRRMPQPGWAVAIGLSMGPNVVVPVEART